jgi:MOSC domain-containing protein YiiM
LNRIEPGQNRRVISVNVGLPRQVEWKGQTVITGIFKKPVSGRITVSTLNLEGDGQGDLEVHGGAAKAIYVYPSEYYDYWRGEMPDVEFGWGKFGENLTTEGFTDDSVHIGDRLQIGTAEVVVTQPRFPCFKLGLKFSDELMVKRFMDRRYNGFYLAVLKEGEVAAGDEIKLLEQEAHRVRVSDITRLFLLDKDDVEGLRRAVQVEALAGAWKKYFREQLVKLTGEQH